MIEEKAILHYNKFKSLREHLVRDAVTGHLYRVLKARKIEETANDFKVMILIRNEITGAESEVDSEYANFNFKEQRS